MTYYLGLDLGGTNIKSGVVTDAGESVVRASRPTEAEKGPDAVIDAMAESARTTARQAGLELKQIAAIGVGAPGPLDIHTGVIQKAPNMPGFEQVPLRDRLADRLGLPVHLENDANAAAFGEFWTGAGRDSRIRHMIMLTLGTGIGSGIILDGQVLHGGFQIAGEGGHMVMNPDGPLCGCGQRGCLEQYASATAVVRWMRQTLEESAGLPADFDAEDVFNAAEAGDAAALRVVGQTTRYLGLACVNLCRLFDPQMIVFAGGMIGSGDFLFSRIRHAFRTRTWAMAPDKVEIVPAQLGNDAGYIGAAAAARARSQ